MLPAARHRTFAHKPQGMADQVLAEWILSDKEELRFVAMVLIKNFHIVSTLPALRELAIRLESIKTPGLHMS
jgi:hypothetical protein